MFRPCDTNFRICYAFVLEVTRGEYSKCTGINVAAFSHMQGRRVFCGDFVMGKMVELSNAPASGSVRGRCYWYLSRDKIREKTAALVAKNLLRIHKKKERLGAS